MTDPERELLSAAFDRQANPAEQARVDEQLRVSEAARREWREFEQLSGLLKDLPRNELPAEFPSRVLKLAEQRSLLPTAPSRSVRSRWLAPFVAAAAALVLVIGVSWLASPPHKVLPVAMRNTDTDKDAVEYATPQETAPRLGHAAPEATTFSPAAGAPAPEVPPGNTAATAPMASMTRGISADRTPQPGEELEKAWGNVEVVRVYLVDSVDGVQAVQAAFAKNEVAVISDPEAVRQRSQSLGTKAEGDEALLVVASNQQIEQSLEDLKKTHKIASVVDEDAVEVARLSDDVKQFFLADVTAKASEAAETVRMQMEEKAVTSAEGAKNEKPSADPTKSTTRAALPMKKLSAGKEAPSRQMVTVFRELSRDEAVSLPARAQAVEESIKPKAEAELVKSASPWRRLIVLVRHSPQPAAAAPAAKP